MKKIANVLGTAALLLGLGALYNVLDTHGALPDLTKSTAWAGEPTYLGSILTTDAGCANNQTSQSGAFRIGGPGTKVTVQTFDASAWVQTSSGCGADRQGLWVPAGSAILTSIDFRAVDAGTYSTAANPGGLISCRPEKGTTTTECLINLSYGR